MFGGLAFLINGKMSVSASGQGRLLLRVDPDETDALLRNPHAQPFGMRGRVMQGWLRVEPDERVALPPAKGATMVGQNSKVSATVLLACVATAGLGGLTGCGSNSNVSANSLKPRLLPASLAPGFHLLRTLDWSDPVNLVGEGIFLPEATHPSQAIKEVRDAGFRGAAGEDLNRGGPTGDDVRTGVVKFKSSGSANKVR